MKEGLREISPDDLKPNPDNPRLIFQEGEMLQLMESIKEVGIKVPITAYQDGKKFVIIDGERRWRSAKRLNLKFIPAIVQRKPTRLENLLMMFNIHNVRIDWDLMPMALKLDDVRTLLEKEGKPTSPAALAAVTGVPQSTVKRAYDLLSLPKRYQDMLLEEAQKPRNQQKVKPDLFLEVYKSMHTVERHAPEVFKEVSKSQYVESMVQKYLTGVEDNVVHYRQVSKMARSELAGVPKEDVKPVIVKLVKNKNYSLEKAFEETVQSAYDRRDMLTRLRGIEEKLAAIKSGTKLEPDFRGALERVASQISRLLSK